MDRSPNNLWGRIDPVEDNLVPIPPLVGDPHFPNVPPEMHDESSEEEDPSEDDPENYPVPGYGPIGEEHHPLGEEDPPEDESEEDSEEGPEYDSLEYSDSDEEGVLEDVQNNQDPQECIIDEEIITPPPPSPRACQLPHQGRGERPILLRTARMNAIPRAGFETVRFEVGESSRAPSQDQPIPPSAAQFNGLAWQVKKIEEDKKIDSSAIQTLYDGMHASRVTEHSMDARIRTLEYQLERTRAHLNAALAQLEELARAVKRRLD